MVASIFARSALAVFFVGSALVFYDGACAPPPAAFFFAATLLGAGYLSSLAVQKHNLFLGRLGRIFSLSAVMAIFAFPASALPLAIFALAAAHTSLLTLAALPPPTRWLRHGVTVATWFLAGSFMNAIAMGRLPPRGTLLVALLVLSSTMLIGLVHMLKDPEAR